MADQTDPTSDHARSRDIFDEARDVVEDSRRLADDVEDMYERARDSSNSLRQMYDRNPYAVLAAAAGTGYILGGGLFSPFTKRIAQMGMKALVVPVALKKLKDATQAAGEDSEPGPDPQPT